ncbi:RNA polymerase sigma-70 factor, ECF subfamily [Salegentibacter holothuriorum]|uniref:RNA polymerase sigma-70 factor, ECF subfamily n=1 Tax=Salegentibacter holothuriorum TaxID=241145 RepID=A0A1T5DJU7_9FLAO|nr:RNA polymerase sigma-70 factor [Salegentibacter holothuriorum]SKB71703.1 RNA polymerase sigma-70 factor, ECF subfamily [Salegentibacter holothuriorum]
MNNTDFSQALKDGDKHAYGSLFEKHYQPLCAYIKSYTQDWDTAQEIVQSTFIVIWQKREKLDINTSLKSYLYKTAYNSFLQMQRANKKQEKLSQRLKEEALREEIFIDEELQERKIKKLREVIEKLPSRCKQVLELKQQGYKYKEIAEKLELSVKSVESQMRIAYQKIRDEFKEDPFFFIIILKALQI